MKFRLNLNQQIGTFVEQGVDTMCMQFSVVLILLSIFYRIFTIKQYVWLRLRFGVFTFVSPFRSKCSYCVSGSSHQIPGGITLCDF